MPTGRLRRESSQGAFESTQSRSECPNDEAGGRSRSVFERAMDVDPTNIKLWLSYTEMVRSFVPCCWGALADTSPARRSSRLATSLTPATSSTAPSLSSPASIRSGTSSA